MSSITLVLIIISMSKRVISCAAVKTVITLDIKKDAKQLNSTYDLKVKTIHKLIELK